MTAQPGPATNLYVPRSFRERFANIATCFMPKAIEGSREAHSQPTHFNQQAALDPHHLAGSVLCQQQDHNTLTVPQASPAHAPPSCDTDSILAEHGQWLKLTRLRAGRAESQGPAERPRTQTHSLPLHPTQSDVCAQPANSLSTRQNWPNVGKRPESVGSGLHRAHDRPQFHP